MPKVRSHASVMHTKFVLNKQIILQKCFMSEEAYNITQWNTAIAWIRTTVWNDEDLVSAIIGQPEFWKWWENQWNLRDEQFLTDHIEYVLYIGCSDILDDEQFKTEWLLTHTAKNITVMPAPEVMRLAFEKVIDKAIKSQAK